MIGAVASTLAFVSGLVAVGNLADVCIQWSLSERFQSDDVALCGSELQQSVCCRTDMLNGHLMGRGAAAAARLRQLWFCGFKQPRLSGNPLHRPTADVAAARWVVASSCLCQHSRPEDVCRSSW
jgi:hypothetical protein